jgi:hypothetical protein
VEGGTHAFLKGEFPTLCGKGDVFLSGTCSLVGAQIPRGI